jgi:hypothetical protein
MSSSSEEAAEIDCEKNKNDSIGDTDATATATTATANNTPAIASAASAFASVTASATATIDEHEHDEENNDGCASCACASRNNNYKNNDNKNRNNNDLTIARAMHVVESLTSLYGFSFESANEAMNNIIVLHENENENENSDNSNNHNDIDIDTIISLCCDYILDNGLGIDDGGAITPINNCPHIVVQVVVGVSDNSSNTQTNNNNNNNDDNNNNNNNDCCCVLITANDIPNNIFELSCQYYSDKANNYNGDNNNNEKQQQQQQKQPVVGKFKDEIEYDDDKDGNATCPKGENWFCLYCGGIYCSRYVNGHGLKHYEDINTINANTNTNTNSHHHCVMVGLSDLSIWCHKCESYLQTHNNTYLNSIINKLQQIKFD